MSKEQCEVTRAVRVSLLDIAVVHRTLMGRADAELLVDISGGWLEELLTNHPREGTGHAFLLAAQLLLH